MMVSDTGPITASTPPIEITQVELWGPTSFYTNGIKLCESNETSLGPWALGWLELHNAENETVQINNVDLTGKDWDRGQFPITLGSNEYCYIPIQDQLSTRIGVGGSLGNGPPVHENSTITLTYSVKTNIGEVNYKAFTPPLNDSFADTRTWQLVDGNWIFKEANVKHEFPVKATLLSPLKQIQSGINVKDLKCKEGFVVIVKKSDATNWYLHDIPACVAPSSASKLVDMGWGVPMQTTPIQNTNSTVTYYVEGSKIDNIMPDLTTHELTLSLDTIGESKMTLFIPRSFMDSREIGDYTSFNITADGNKINYHEYLTPTDRMFTILFHDGTKNIHIIPKQFTGNQG